MKLKMLLVGWCMIVLFTLSTIGSWVYKVDPYFHYHKPDVDNYFYILDNQRSQNDGISKHFDYDALITGTSMTENFKTSEMDEIFKVNSIKVPYSGGSYEEINNNLEVALKNNPKLNTIIRSLDMEYFFDNSNRMRDDLGVFPTYLYDNNLFNDVKYLYNKEVVFSRVYQMSVDKNDVEFKPGITSFDEYGRWANLVDYGINTVCADGIAESAAGEPAHITAAEKEIIKENIDKNVTSTAGKYPDVDFYYFFLHTALSGGNGR